MGELEKIERRHGPDCECDRCKGWQPGNEHGVRFEQGNQLAKTHGAYSTQIAQGEETLALADQIRESMPWYVPTDAVTVSLLAITLIRVKRAVAAIEAADAMHENPLAPYLVKDAAALRTLREDVRLWIGQAHKLASSLGLDPLSRSRLGVNVARIEESIVAKMQRQARELEAAP